MPQADRNRSAMQTDVNGTKGARKLETRILFWDIETTNLNADFGTILAIGYKWAHEKRVRIIKINDYETFEDDRTDDSGVVADFLKVWESADIHVTYNGTLFDVPYVTAKMMEYRLGITPNVPHVDLYFIAKKLRISRKSMQNVGYFLGISNEKTPVEGKIWKRAMTGHEPSIKYIVDHCKADILVTEELYNLLKPLRKTHPPVSEVGACHVCGSSKLQRRGKYVSSSKIPKTRVQCQDCGGWSIRTL